jgi:type I restriction enzyme M protein
MITGELKSKIDKLWQEFWQGGIANPLTVIEQVTFLMYARLLDMEERKDEKRAQITNKPFNRRFNDDEQHIRWDSFRHQNAEQMLHTIRDEVFPHFKRLAGSSESLLGTYLKDAQLMVQKPNLLVSAVNQVNELPLQDSDTKGDLYEYLLSKLTTAGINGQFRTPRHIIRMMVDMSDPAVENTIADPACGTAGFLQQAHDFLLQKYTSEQGVHFETIINQKGESEQQATYSGDLLTDEQRKHLNNSALFGFDFDATMLRIAAMNLLMHGVEQPGIYYQDTLSQSFSERHPKLATSSFDLILANPPFKGSLDEEDVDSKILSMVKTKKTELLFVAQILRMLKLGGRAAVVVPDGVLFGASKAHQKLRETLIEQNQLEGVVSLPSGVFKPYAGVSTAILFFAKGGSTDKVWFYNLEADGYSLDDKRSKIEADDLPDCLTQWQNYQAWLNSGDEKSIKQAFGNKAQKAFLVEKADIAKNKYDLSINQYKETKYEEEDYKLPNEIIEDLVSMEAAIASELQELQDLVK